MMNITCASTGQLNTCNLTNIDEQLPTWIRYTLLSYMVIIFVLGIPGNTTVVIVMAKNRSRTSTDNFILFMSILDLLLVGVNVPGFMKMYTNSSRIIGSSNVCKAHYFLYNFHIIASALLFAVMGLDRYMCICRNNTSNFIHRYPKITSVTCVLLSLVLSGRRIQLAGLKDGGKCVYAVQSRFNVQTIITSSVLFSGCGAIFFAYIKIIKQMRARVVPVSVPPSVCLPSTSSAPLPPCTKGEKRKGAITSREANCTDTIPLSVKVMQTQSNINERLPPAIQPECTQGAKRNGASTSMEATCIDTISQHVKVSFTQTNIKENSPNLMGNNLKQTRKPQDTSTVQKASIDVPKSTVRDFQRGTNPRRERLLRSSNVLIVMSTVFIGLTIIPMFVISLLESSIKSNGHVKNIFSLVNKTYFINAVVSPILYYKMNSSFREQVLRLFNSSSR